MYAYDAAAQDAQHTNDHVQRLHFICCRSYITAVINKQCTAAPLSVARQQRQCVLKPHITAQMNCVMGQHVCANITHAEVSKVWITAHHNIIAMSEVAAKQIWCAALDAM